MQIDIAQNFAHAVNYLVHSFPGHCLTMIMIFICSAQLFKDTGNTQIDELFSLILHLGVVLKNDIIEQ